MESNVTCSQALVDRHLLTGTHTAGIAVGRNVGVAKEANIVAVRVLDCSGSGVVSDVISGANFGRPHHLPTSPTPSAYSIFRYAPHEGRELHLFVNTRRAGLGGCARGAACSGDS